MEEKRFLIQMSASTKIRSWMCEVIKKQSLTNPLGAMEIQGADWLTT